MKWAKPAIGISTVLILVLGAVFFFKFSSRHGPPREEEAVYLLPGSPMPIPHFLDGRRRCVSCHVGVAAHPDIRTSHPERENCMQCHVPKRTTQLFQRP